MTPPNVKRHLVCPSGSCSHHCWEIEVGSDDRCPICGAVGDAICACGCGASLAGLRSDAVYRSEACAKRLQRNGRPDIDPTQHPLRDARAAQEATDLKSKLSELIYQAIISKLEKGPVHADDLEDLFPEEHRGLCRRLTGAQFGSLASRHYIFEKERRKSSVPSRKGAKSGVFEFTRKGREKLTGVDSDHREGSDAGAKQQSLDRPGGFSLALPAPNGARDESAVHSGEASRSPAGSTHGASSAPAGEPRPTSEAVPLFEEEQRPKSAVTDPEVIDQREAA